MGKKEIMRENSELQLKVKELEAALLEKDLEIEDLNEQVDNLPPSDHNATLELIFQFSKQRFELIETIKSLAEKEQSIYNFLKSLKHRHPKAKAYIEEQLSNDSYLSLKYSGYLKYENVRNVYLKQESAS